jgi:signal transduction histidine kinase
VAVAWLEDDVTILVENDGSTTADSSTMGRGILGMRERVALYDGAIEAGPNDDGGWLVRAHLRWNEP